MRHKDGVPHAVVAGRPTPALHFAARLLRGDFELALDLDLADGEVLAVLGPNGAGKSSLVLALAGLLPLDAGQLSLGGRLLEAPDAGIYVPARKRGIGVVFQSHRLFGHMSLRENVAYGLRARGTARRLRGPIAEAWLERVGLAELADERASRLSVGQAQRAALARALAFGPELLLLDEPFAALDAEARPAAMSLLATLLRGPQAPRCTLLVTHEAAVAEALADRWLILEAGRATQLGNAESIAAAPASPYVRSLL
jgi:molybdate transport system ATP-binding protein